MVTTKQNLRVDTQKRRASKRTLWTLTQFIKEGSDGERKN